MVKCGLLWYLLWWSSQKLNYMRMKPVCLVTSGGSLGDHVKTLVAARFAILTWCLCISVCCVLLHGTHIPVLTHWDLVCISELSHHCFRQWLISCLVPKHYLNQSRFIVSWTLWVRTHSSEIRMRMHKLIHLKVYWLQNSGHWKNNWYLNSVFP